MGGQGFLKRDEVIMGEVGDGGRELYEPYRQVLEERSLFRRGNIPFYTCGDQQHSCEAYNQSVSSLEKQSHP